MTDERARSLLVNTLQTSAAKLKAAEAELEVRRTGLDELEARLYAERDSLKGQAQVVESSRAASRQERQGLARTRSALDRAASAARADRETAASEAKRLREWARVLKIRDRVLQEAEDRVVRRLADLSGRMEDSKARLHDLAEREALMAQRERELQETVARLSAIGQALKLRDRSLVEREEAFVRRAHDRVEALSTREQELAAFRDAISAIAAGATARSKSYGALHAALEKDVDRIVIARESLAADEERLREADAILSGATEPSDTESEGEPASADAPVPEGTIRPGSEEDVPVPAEVASAPVLLVADGKIMETWVLTTKNLAVGRLAQVVVAWERARAAGWDVSELRGSARSARDALASGDYEAAVRLATTILDRLPMTPGAR